ncbi:MAG: hypothetical protein JJLCMIEE_01183 [Acidimicrobiales bacterium]|nr:MAG: SAM-dependent methyltransferase [Actinomycetota bacterium]MBV6508123.1 hypothetical protein [Acidimicrobiales bacterium]RIK03868.1 MAG: SAM-dependent methyltransferase [Acidobacteriota bacterium]
MGFFLVRQPCYACNDKENSDDDNLPGGHAMAAETSADGSRRGDPDPNQVALFAFQVWNYRQGELVALMIHLGDRLGLYQELWGAGPVTATELAENTGLSARWLLEWLRAQAAAGLVDSEDGVTFEMTDVQGAVLADEYGSLFFAAGAFAGPPSPDVIDGLAEAFRTGTGLPYDSLGEAGAQAIDRVLSPWSRLALLPRIIPALEGVEEKLRAGCHVADIGCGAGMSLAILAEAFPTGRYHGYDPSLHAINRARHKMAEAGLGNVVLHHAGGEEVSGDEVFDLVLSFDCLHDMPHPDRVARAVRRSIAADGTWLIKEVRSSGEFATDRKNPMLALMYSSSVATCMSSALSEPDGMGLGTLGLPPETLRELTREAGFTRFALHDFDDPANLYYEVRP